MQLTPAASATPDGKVRINILISARMEEDAELAELVYGMDLVEAVSENGIYKLAARPQARANLRSSRKEVVDEFGGLTPRCMGGCTCKSRSHELHKSQLRLERRGR